MSSKIVFLTSGTIALVVFLSYKIYRKKFRTSELKDVLPVYVCDDIECWNKNESFFLTRFKKASVIGLDCEWVTIGSSRNPVALLQLATADGLCVLVRLCKIPVEQIPENLLDLLSDPSIIKVGVGVVDDSQKLLRDYYMIVNGCLDLRHTVQDDPSFRGKAPGLKTLAQDVLDVKLKKNKFLTCSDWESEYLNSKQVAYAAEDALASAQIFDRIHNNNNLSWWRRIFRNSFQRNIKKWEVYLDMPFKLKVSSDPLSSDAKTKHVQVKPLYRNKLLARRKPMYENCQLQAPDGEVLCSCDRKKAMWYVHKGRGEIVEQTPFTVRLNFEPSDRPILDNAYYIQQKSNCCVVCGETRLFFRKQIVPSEYRKYFPELMKKSLSHDILLLCIVCHRKSNIIDQTLREKLAIECDAPIGSDKGIKIKRGPMELVKVKSAAKALVCSGDKIPSQRKEELMNIIKEYYKIEEVSDEFLKQLKDLDTCQINEDYIPHGLKVYEYFCKNGGLIKFESLWRSHFLDTMKPKFLPSMWSVDHNHERLAVKVQRNKVDFDVTILGLTQEMLDKAKLIVDSNYASRP